jgi:hypothetical protein
VRGSARTLLAAALILAFTACGSDAGTTAPRRATTTTSSGAAATVVPTSVTSTPTSATSATTTTALPPQAPADRSQVAQAARITKLLTEERWAEVRREFDEQLQRDMSEQRLAELWGRAKADGGRLLGIGDTFFAARGEDFAVWDTDLDFERTDAKIRITFDAANKVSALSIVAT